MEDLKQYWDDRDAVVRRLVKFITDDPQSLSEYARRIGVATPTLVSIIKGERPIEFATWCKINKYLDKIEKKKQK